MPQKLHSRVKALFSQPENPRYIFPVLQTFVCQNVDSVVLSKSEGVSCGLESFSFQSEATFTEINDEIL